VAELPAHPRDYTTEQWADLMVNRPAEYFAAREVLADELVQQAGARAAAQEWRHLRAVLLWFVRRWRRG
jgi:hypothetical protein